MNMPGFTAEASVHRTSIIYHSAYGTLAGDASVMVIPQQCSCVQWVCPPRDCTVTGCPPGLVCCDCLFPAHCTTQQQCQRECRL